MKTRKTSQKGRQSLTIKGSNDKYAPNERNNVKNEQSSLFESCYFDRDSTVPVGKLFKFEETVKFFAKRKVLTEKGEIKVDLFPTYGNNEKQLNARLTEYIITHFTLWELYLIFYQNQCSRGFGKKVLKEAKQDAIAAINCEEGLTARQAKRLRKLVWDMNPILFGLILNFVVHSSLFYEEETDTYFYQEFKLSRD